MVSEPDLITTMDAMYMKYIVVNSDWYTMGRDYLLNETGESVSILGLQAYYQGINWPWSNYRPGAARCTCYRYFIYLKNIYIGLPI